MIDFTKVEKKQPVKVQGENGTFVFISAEYTDKGECTSVCVWGGLSKREKFRHFLPARITVLKGEIRP